MADSTAFGNYFAATTGMGNPATKSSTNFDPFEQELLNSMDPNLRALMYFNKKREDAYTDPQRIREQYQVAKEIRLEEAQEAARIQAERDKRSFEYQMLASIPKTISEVSSNIAQMTYNAPRLQILANIPEQIRAAYGSIPTAVLRSPSFSRFG